MTSHQIAQAILADIMTRKGFFDRSYWDGVSPETQERVLEAWATLIEGGSSRVSLTADAVRPNAHLDRSACSRCADLVSALRKVNAELTVSAAEYVPAIPAAWAIIEAALRRQIDCVECA